MLNNSKDAAFLRDKGYVVIPFLVTDEIRAIQNYYDNTYKTLQTPFHTTHFSTNFELKRDVNSFLIKTCERAIRQNFQDNYMAIFANFMVKEGGGQNPMPLHADWSYVDEEEHSSYSLWIPLIDTNLENGCFSVIPFSHHLSHHIRGPRILQWNFPTNEEIINKFGVPLPLKAGYAIVFNHRLLHYSGSNLTSQRRVAFNISLVPTNTELLHYAVPEGETKILKFTPQNQEFFICYNNFQMPESECPVERIDPSFQKTFDDSYTDFLSKFSDEFKQTYLRKERKSIFKKAFDFCKWAFKSRVS
jgi:ectoine hydroxylase-related dioxygenase (phytanoyl-CoA dioxygenase family)